MLSFFRKYHKWPSLIFTFFIMLFAISGIILNHREWFSCIDISRKLLPESYSLKNWNQAAIKGSVNINSDSLIVFGNIGAWVTNHGFNRFTDLNKGFPSGIDNRKITSMFQTKDGRLLAGTIFGLYYFDSGAKEWKLIPLPVKEKRIVRILPAGDSLLVMTRSNLLWTVPGKTFPLFKVIPVPAAINDDQKTGLFKTIWVIHSGEIYGLAGKLIIDLVGILFIILCITGLIWFIVPSLIKHFREGIRKQVRQFSRNTLRLHNWIGSWFLPVLILTSLTGIFLRPPLLIPIANTRVAKIKFSELDSPNPWFDRFRDLIYDQEKQRFLFATSEGIFYSGVALNSALKPFPYQPPVSVMGINVFENLGSGHYLVGSFNGLFVWNPETGKIRDYFTGLDYLDTGQMKSPFGNLTVSGYLRLDENREYIFDYTAGGIGLKTARALPIMPQNVVNGSPMSLWNASLELHTGRIYEPVIGKLYILVVPLTGIATLGILLTGFFSWWLAKKKKIAKR